MMALPDARGLVPACGDDALAIGRIRGGGNIVRMPFKHGQGLSTGRVPDARGLVTAYLTAQKERPAVERRKPFR